MKYQLNRFIPKCDKSYFSNDLILSSYAVVKQKFINKYMHTHLARMQEALSIRLDQFPTISAFINQMQINLKTFCPDIVGEPALCGALLRTLPQNLQSLIYISGNHNSLDRILNYAEILDNRDSALDPPQPPPVLGAHRLPSSSESAETEITSAAGSVSTQGTKRSRGPKAKPRKNLRKAKSGSTSKKD